jgi:hypothetical protein
VTGRDESGLGEAPTERKLTRALKRVLYDWTAGNGPRIDFEDSGEWVVTLPDSLKVNFLGEGTRCTPLESAQQEAVRWFAKFLDSPLRYSLCKCRSCDEYYYTERTPRGRIEFGTYCPRHRQSASARRSYEARRAPAQDKRLSIAAAWWGKWPKSMTDEGQQARWIARKVNEGVSPKWTRIGRNWVTLHKSEIERRSCALHGNSQTTKGKVHAESKRT